MDTMIILPNRPFLSSTVNGDLKFIKYIKQDFMNSVLSGLKNVDSYLFLKRKRIEIENNAKDFLNFYNKSKSDLLKLKSDHYFDLNPLFIESNRLFINFSTSVRVLTSIIEKKIKDTYTESDKEFLEFENIRKGFYDSYFSYRFIYHVRNFALHFQYPIHFINVEYNDYILDNPIKKDLHVMFDKDHLLKNKEFSRKMKKDLASYGSKFPANPIIEETLKWLKDYFSKFISVEKATYLKTVTTVESLGNIYSYQNLGMSLKEPTSKTGFKISTTDIPIRLLLEIKTNLT
jgi:hypothetical protein